MPVLTGVTTHESFPDSSKRFDRGARRITSPPIPGAPDNHVDHSPKLFGNTFSRP